MPGQGHSSSPSPSAGPMTSERSESEDPSRSHCNCGKGDGSGNYVLCDNDDCKVGWYHWECVRVIEEPVGTWLCPSCSPNEAFYVKQLVQKREAPPLVPKIEHAVLGARKKEVTTKAVGVKRPAAPKPKPRWPGWVELSSEGEDDFKKRVDAQWNVDHAISGKRRRVSKAVNEDTEVDSRTLRRDSRVGRRKRTIDTDSDEDEGESVYQNKDQQQHEEEEGEEDDEEALVHRKVSVVISSGDSDDSECAMDVDAGADDANEDSAEEPSDPHSESAEERHISPDLVRTVSGVEAEDLEGSEDVIHQNKSLEANSSHGSDLSEYVDANEYMDDNEASEASRTRVNASDGREVAVSHIVQVSERAIRHEDAIDVDGENESNEVQILDHAPPAVESNNRAPRYQRQGNCWGEFPESAIRSTLPRLA